jgi:hypothetical protein
MQHAVADSDRTDRILSCRTTDKGANAALIRDGSGKRGFEGDAAGRIQHRSNGVRCALRPISERGKKQ